MSDARPIKRLRHHMSRRWPDARNAGGQMVTEKSGHVIAYTIAIDAEGDVIAYRLQHDTDITTVDLVAVLDQLASMIEAEDDT